MKTQCKNCIHVYKNPGVFTKAGLECHRPYKGYCTPLVIDPECDIQRKGGVILAWITGCCGKHARFFEGKETEWTI